MSHIFLRTVFMFYLVAGITPIAYADTQTVANAYFLAVDDDNNDEQQSECGDDVT